MSTLVAYSNKAKKILGFMISLTTYFTIATFSSWCRLPLHDVHHKALQVTLPILR